MNMSGINIGICMMVLMSIGLQGCWVSDAKLISDHEADKFGSGQYLFVSLYGQDKDVDKYLLQRMPGAGHKFHAIDAEQGKETSFIVQFYDLGGYIGPDQYILQISMDDNSQFYQYMAVVEIENGWRFLWPDDKLNESQRSPSSLIDLKSRISTGLKSGNLKSKVGTIEEMTAVDATRYIDHARDQAEKEQAALTAKAQAEALQRQNIMAAEMVRRQIIADQNDKEPTESEMSQAIKRSTLAGAMIQPQVRKHGSCRKAGEGDYYCRYEYLGYNWGNFWKNNGVWYFKIVEE